MARGWKGPRPVALRLQEAVMLDVFPDSPATIADFWITDQKHYEALYYPIRAGEITAEDLDRVLGDPAKITKLVNKSPSNPHKGIVFGKGSGLGAIDDPNVDKWSVEVWSSDGRYLNETLYLTAADMMSLDAALWGLMQKGLLQDFRMRKDLPARSSLDEFAKKVKDLIAS